VHIILFYYHKKAPISRGLGHCVGIAAERLSSIRIRLISYKHHLQHRQDFKIFTPKIAHAIEGDLAKWPAGRAPMK
jgi:hypothetical protein